MRPPSSRLGESQVGGLSSSSSPPRSLLAQAKRRIYPLRPPSVILNDILGHKVPFEFSHGPSVNCRVSYNGRIYSVSGLPSRRAAKDALAYRIIPDILKRKNELQASRGARCGRKVGFEKREDETPWASLCSLALYMLFEEWTEKGLHVPRELIASPLKKPAHPFIAPGGVGRLLDSNDSEKFLSETHRISDDIIALWKKEEVKTGKSMPDNPTGRPPIQLLNDLRPGLRFNTVSQGGQTSNPMFITLVEIEGRIYSGEARSKRSSKRLCATKALKLIYGIEYLNPCQE